MSSTSPSIVDAMVYRVERIMLGPIRGDLRHNVWIETIASILFGLFWATTVGFFPVILRNMGANEDQLALYVVFQSFGLILTPISVAIFQRYRIVKIASYIWMFGRGTLLLVPFVGNNVSFFMIIIGIFWICELVPSPGYVRLLERLYPDNVRGRIMSFVRIGMTFAILVMTPVAGWLLDIFDHTVVIPIVAIFGILASVVFMRLKVDDAPVQRSASHAAPALRDILKEISTNRSFMLFLILNTLFGCGTLIGAPLYAVVQVNRLGLSYTEVGYLGLLQSITWLLGFFFWGSLVDKKGPIFVLLISMFCGALMPLGFMLADSFWWLVPAFIAQGLLLGGFDLGFTNTAMNLANRSQLEAYFAAIHLVGGIRGIIVPLTTPVLVSMQVSESVIFGIGVGFILISMLLAIGIKIKPASLETA
ncbi:MAG: MFS transporter [Chloroflexi bacterium]|nr:MFS transporter [Chloroflexota bacterium]